MMRSYQDVPLELSKDEPPRTTGRVLRWASKLRWNSGGRHRHRLAGPDPGQERVGAPEEALPPFEPRHALDRGPAKTALV